MKFKLFQFDESGVALHLLLPIAAVIGVAAIGTYFYSVSHAAQPSCYNSYKIGWYWDQGDGEDKGASTYAWEQRCVKDIQTMVNFQIYGYNANSNRLAIDGQYGPKTYAAVKTAQRLGGIPLSGQDGVVGPQTFGWALCQMWSKGTGQYATGAPYNDMHDAGCPGF
jgi:hypothetical protein